MLNQLDPTVWKNEKFTLTEKIFLQINYLVIMLVKTSFSRNFCQKTVKVNDSQCGNCCDLVSHFWQKFGESNVITIEITKELI